MSDSNLPRGEFVKAIFSRERRLDIWGAVLKHSVEPPEIFYCKQLTKDIAQTGQEHLPYSAVQNELTALEVLGMIQRTPPSAGTIIHYQRVDSPMWDVVGKAITVTDSLYPPTGQLQLEI